MNDKPTETLARFVTDLDLNMIPKSVVEYVKLCILDTVGCGLSGSKDYRSKTLTNAMTSVTAPGPCRIWNSDMKLSPIDVTLVNGSYVHMLDYDDQCMEVGLHAGACIIPPILAQVEIDPDLDGPSILVSAIAGYECAIRIGMAFGLDPVKKGWHVAGFNGSLGSAIAMSRLFEMNAEKIEDAIGLAATQGSGLMSVQYGSDAKALHTGKAAQSGYISALLATNGFRGIKRVLELKYGGYFSTLSKHYDMDVVTADLGKRYFLLEKLGLKAYPGVRMTHAPIEAIQKILSKGISLDEIFKIDVYVNKISKKHVGWEYTPTGVSAALSSIQFGMANFLLNGFISPEFYSPEQLANPNVMRIIKKIKVHSDRGLDIDDPHGMAARVEVTLTNGDRYLEEVKYPKGTPRFNPLSKDEIIKKLRVNVKNVAKATGLINVILNLEKHQRLDTLIGLLGKEE